MIVLLKIIARREREVLKTGKVRWEYQIGGHWMRDCQLQMKGTRLTAVLQGTREEKEKQGTPHKSPPPANHTGRKTVSPCCDKNRKDSSLHFLLLDYKHYSRIKHYTQTVQL